MKRGRSEKLIGMRDIAMVARYYYWSEMWERRYDKVLHTLSNQEFFLAESTIERILMLHDDYLVDLRKRRPDVKEMGCKFPGFNWQENTKFGLSKKQLSFELQ